MRLDGKVSVSGDVVLRVPQSSVLGPLFVLYTSALFHIVGKHMVGYADDATIAAVISRLLSRPQEMASLNRDLAATHSWYLKWHMRLNSRKTKSMVVSRCHTYAPGYGDLTLGGEKLGEVKCLHILEVIFDSKLTFEPHLREIGSKAAGSLVVVRRARKFLLQLVILDVQVLCVSQLWRSRATDIINSVGRFCMLLSVCGTCCRRNVFSGGILSSFRSAMN